MGAISLAAVTLTAFYLGGSFLRELNFAGRPPCQTSGSFFKATWILLPIALLVAIWLQIRAFKRRSMFAILLALAVPLGAWSAHAFASKLNKKNQAACEKRPLTEAMRFCAANPKYYRQGKDGYGYDTMTLVAPGTTDKAWNCLYSWASRNGSTSMIVDESVYEAARRNAGAK
jgi:hypothetical protein